MTVREFERAGYVRAMKTGLFYDSEGRPQLFTRQRLKEMADSYKPDSADFKEAPFLIGHVHDGAPAQGWVGDVQAVEDSLVLKPSSINSNFAEKLRRKEFKYVSLSIRKDNTIRHCAFVPVPAVGGLGPVPESMYSDFSESSEGNADDAIVLSFDYSELSTSSQTDEATIQPNTNQEHNTKNGAVSFVKEYPSKINETTSGVQTAGKEVIMKKDEPANAGNQEPSTVTVGTEESPDPFAEINKRLGQLETENAELRKTANAANEMVTKFKTKASQKEASDFVEAGIKKGFIYPKNRQKAIEIMMAIQGDTFNFSEGEAADAPQSVFEGVSELLKNAGASIPLKPLSGAFAHPANFSEGGGDDDAVYRRAKEIQKASGVTYSEALERAEGEF